MSLLFYSGSAHRTPTLLKAPVREPEPCNVSTARVQGARTTQQLTVREPEPRNGQQPGSRESEPRNS